MSLAGNHSFDGSHVALLGRDLKVPIYDPVIPSARVELGKEGVTLT
jgi:hypothetical protein